MTPNPNPSPSPNSRAILAVDCGHTAIKTALVHLQGPWTHPTNQALQFPKAQLHHPAHTHHPDHYTTAFDPAHLATHTPSESPLNTDVINNVVRLLLQEILNATPAAIPNAKADAATIASRLAGVAISAPQSLRTALIPRLTAQPQLDTIPWAILSPLDDWPILNGYDTPQTVGPDRLAACVGAAARHPSPDPFLVATAGTAITVNLVLPPQTQPPFQTHLPPPNPPHAHLPRPIFRGGAILPGYHAFLRSLAIAAPTLSPAVEQILLHKNWTAETFPADHPAFLGASTPSNLRRGALEGVAGAFAQNLSAQDALLSLPPDKPMPLYLTGGDAQPLAAGLRAMSPSTHRPINLQPDLVLEGLALTLDYLTQSQ